MRWLPAPWCGRRGCAVSARYAVGVISLVACHSAPNPPPATVVVRPPEISGSASSAPTPLATPSPMPTAAKGVKILDVDIQTTHACALTQERALRCWGDNKLGQLGYGDRRSRLAAEVVDVPLPGPVDSFAVDPGSTCAVVQGVPYCWGNVLAEQGSIEIGDDEPVVPAGRVVFDKPVRSIAQGWNFACLIDVEGDVTCWGARDRGELGACPKSGCRASARQPNEMRSVNLGFKASAISLGADHGCAVGPAGNVRCWGFAGEGKLGYISPHQSRPAEVGDLQRGGNLNA